MSLSCLELPLVRSCTICRQLCAKQTRRNRLVSRAKVCDTCGWRKRIAMDAPAASLFDKGSTKLCRDVTVGACCVLSRLTAGGFLFRVVQCNVGSRILVDRAALELVCFSLIWSIFPRENEINGTGQEGTTADGRVVVGCFGPTQGRSLLATFAHRCVVGYGSP